MDDQRGKILHKQRSKQVKDYSKLRYGNITPTDIDGFMDFQNKVFVILEYKNVTAPALTYGQELALVRLVDNLAKSKPTVGVIAEHNTKDDEEIACHDAKVVKYRSSGKWQEPTKPLTVKALVDGFLKKNGIVYEAPKDVEEVPDENQPKNNQSIENKEQYEEVKKKVDALSKRIDESSGWLSEEPAMKKMVNEQQRMAGMMLEYEVEHDMLPI